VGTPAPGAPLVLGRYRLLSRLGAGGFGVVWSAHDEVLDRHVAVKRIALPEGASSDRAVREALAAARLAHPAIVSLYEAGAEADSFVIVSELVDGSTLASLIGARSLRDDTIAEIGLALADALEHAHARGVIHRDVKPQNVLIPAERDEGGAPAKLADFGGARLAGEETLTRTGDVVGTLAYMAPEQAATGEAREEADLYSLALVLYEAFSGVNPVRGPTAAATARRLGTRLPPLTARRPDLPRVITRAIDAAVDPRPHRRRSVGELAESLDEALQAGLADRRGGHRREPPAAPEPWTPPGEDDDLEGVAPAPALTRRRRGRAAAALATALAPAPEAHELPRSPPSTLSLRAACALPAAALAAAALSSRSLGGATPPLGAPVAAASAALAVGLAPRLGWAALAAATATWVAAAGHAGAAVVLAVGALAVLALLRRPGPAWSAPVLAPLLGAVGLAGAYPALAGQTAPWPRRAAVGALGYWWLCLAEPLTGQRLWLGPPPGVAAHGAWEASASSALTHVVWPLLVPGTLFGALLWAAAAAALPLLVTGRALALDLVGATAWAAGLCAAAPAVDRGLGAHGAATPRGAIADAVLAGALAVAARAVRGPAGPTAGPSSPRAGARETRRGPVSRAL
jgi:hypothetical protein